MGFVSNERSIGLLIKEIAPASDGLSQDKSGRDQIGKFQKPYFFTLEYMRRPTSPPITAP